jgi:hypothetical protein
MRTAARVDANQKEIVEGLRKLDAYVLITSQLKNAFDILVGYKGNTYIIEIKDGSKPEKQRQLTKGELKCMEGFQKVGVKYHVINSLDEAISLLTS